MGNEEEKLQQKQKSGKKTLQHKTLFLITLSQYMVVIKRNFIHVVIRVSKLVDGRGF